MFSFEDMRLLEGTNYTWKELQESLSNSWEELLKENLQLTQERNKHKNKAKPHLEKIRRERY